jgi:hypothetical protein
MPVFQTIAARLHARFFPEDAATFTVRTTPRIARFVKPIIEKLIRDDRAGETSLCRIDGPSITDERGYRPTGGLVETPGLTARLSPDEANDLDNRIKAVIETTIREWADESNRGRRTTLPQHQLRGVKDA